MSVGHNEPETDAARLRQRGLRVTGPRLAILAVLEEVGGHRSADELVLALRGGGYHHARTTVYNALDDLAQVGLVRSAPVDAGALRYEICAEAHHHFVCRRCGGIRNVAVADDLAARAMPAVEGAEPDDIDIVYRGLCSGCAEDLRSEDADRSRVAPAGSRGARSGRHLDVSRAEALAAQGLRSDGAGEEPADERGRVLLSQLNRHSAGPMADVRGA